MHSIDVVSVGPGCEGLLTQEAQDAIARADAVFCAGRHAGLVPDAAHVRPLAPFDTAIAQMAAMQAEGARVAVLVSGDAGLYSLLPLLVRRLGHKRIRVRPGVSALQAFAAAMGVSWQDARILSAHGRALSEGALCHVARTNGQVFLFLDAQRDPAWVRGALDAGGLAHVRMTVGERLSYPEERIEAYAPHAYDPLCMVCLENDAPACGLPPVGIADEEFVRGKTPMTKREVRVQVIAALRLTPEAVVWDIGAGTGSVAVECARQCPLGQVYAVERDAQAMRLIEQNRAKFFAVNLMPVAGSAPDALAGLPAPTHVFLGGTGGMSDAVLDLLERLPGSVRVAATAVTMESAQRLLVRMRGYEAFSAVQVAVSRLEEMSGYTMLRAQNPVFLFAGSTRRKEQA